MPEATETAAPAATPEPAAPTPSAIASAPVPPAPATSASKTFTQEEVNRLLGERAQRAADGARAQLLGTLKDYGVGSTEDLTTLVRTAHEAKQAQMTELQRAQERTKTLETELARARADAEARAEDMRRSRVFRENSVAPEYEDVLGVLLDRAKTEAPQTFDERAWLESIKKQRPLLFGSPPAPTAPSSPPIPVGATTGAIFPAPPAAPTAPQGTMPAFDARSATSEDLRRWEQSLGIAVPSGGRI
jgi:hypothetical protein